jgi:hypothetical protein
MGCCLQTATVLLHCQCSRAAEHNQVPTLLFACICLPTAGVEA